MNKPYLLIAGDKYYPEEGTQDWVACYATREEAEQRWDELSKKRYRYGWH